MRKLTLCIILSLAMALTPVSVFADAIHDTIPVCANEGLRVVTPEASDLFERFSCSVMISSTKYDGIAVSADGLYAMEVETIHGIEHVPVGKLTINLANANEVEAALQRDDLTDEMRVYIVYKLGLIPEMLRVVYLM